MSFGSIWGRAWNDYKNNFSSLSLLMLLFYVIPWLLMFYLIFNNPVSNMSMVLVFLAFILISSYGIASIIKISFKKNKFNFNEAVKSMKGRYLAYLWLVIVFGFYLTGLFILLIIPGIIFLIYWIFSYYIFLGEGKGIHESLRESKKTVKGNWWMVFGYGLLIMLIYILVSVIIEIVFSKFGLSFETTFPGTENKFSISFAELILSFFSTPIIILFGKHLYFELKKGKKK